MRSPTQSLRQTKIVATIGPASSDRGCLRELLDAGVDVVRLNFSHGTHDEHGRVIDNVRALARESGRCVAVLLDLQGPRLRVGGLGDHPVELRAGQSFTLTTRAAPGATGTATVNYEGLARELSPGDELLINDGRVRLRVAEIVGDEIRCTVEVGGPISNGKGLNVPGVGLQVPTLTDKDLMDLEFGLRLGVDYVALSFVKGPEDAATLKAEMDRLGARAPMIAKIERAAALGAMDAILRAFDGVMVARGDLGVEVGTERVPMLQKQIIARANELLKPVITATQMLESMITSPRPTRAEASDVANAILDGTDAVMLSAETSIGDYPLEAVRFMDRMAAETDATPLSVPPQRRAGRRDPALAVVEAGMRLATEARARAVVIFTTSGRTAQLVAKARPTVPAHAFTSSETVVNRLALWRGIVSHQTKFERHTTEMIGVAEDTLLRDGAVQKGDRIVVVGSSPLTVRGRTNFLKVHTVSGRRGPPAATT